MSPTIALREQHGGIRIVRNFIKPSGSKDSTPWEYSGFYDINPQQPTIFELPQQDFLIRVKRLIDSDEQLISALASYFLHAESVAYPDIESLEGLYTFINQNGVKRFLLMHDYLINPLFETHGQIRRVFGENVVEISLDYDRDPEEDFEGLFVSVKTRLSPKSSLDLLEKFDEEWWLGISDEIRAVLSVMVRPV